MPHLFVDGDDYIPGGAGGMEAGDWYLHLTDCPAYCRIWWANGGHPPALRFGDDLPSASDIPAIEAWMKAAWAKHEMPGIPPDVATRVQEETAARAVEAAALAVTRAAWEASTVLGWATHGCSFMEEWRLVGDRWMKPCRYDDSFDETREAYIVLPDVNDRDKHPVTLERLVVMGRPLHGKMPNGDFRRAYAWMFDPTKKGKWYGEPQFPVAAADIVKQ